MYISLARRCAPAGISEGLYLFIYFLSFFFFLMSRIELTDPLGSRKCVDCMIKLLLQTSVHVF